MSRTQTMVQLTEELVGDLDAEARRRDMSRSALIREVLTDFLDEVRANDMGARIAAAYRLHPPETPDEWGDPASVVDVGARELAQRLDAEERRLGHQPW